ncbi:hypothetical protein FHU26_002678 [Clostridium beijerinckii]|nr:hypothetical protein [Clostridium beijerinckii]
MASNNSGSNRTLVPEAKQGLNRLKLRLHQKLDYKTMKTSIKGTYLQGKMVALVEKW